MANSKISDLTELTSAADADVLAIVDDSASETKKITFANLASSITVGSTTELQFTGTNITGTAIAKGKAVYISGAQGNDTTIALADNSAAATMPAFGITKEEIANNSSGVVVLAGTLTGVNTVAYSEGDELFVSTSGDLTDTKPTGTALIQKIAKVAKSAASGSLVVTGAGRTNDLPNLPDGQIWIGDSNGVPQDKTLTGGTNVTITEDASSVTIAAATPNLDAVTDEGATTTNDITVGGFSATATGQGSIDASGNGLLDGTLKLTGSATAAYALAIYDSTDTFKAGITPAGLVNVVQVFGSSYIHGTTVRVGGSLNTPAYTLTSSDGTAGRPLSTDGAGDVAFRDSITCDVTGDLTGNVDGTELEVVTQTTAVDAAGEAEGTIVKFGTGTLVAGQVYTHASGAWVAVDADAQTTTEGLLGMALGTSPTTNGLLVHGVGYLSHDPGTAGDVLYLSATAGYLTGTQPSTTGQFVRVAGYCLADNKVFFSPSQDFIEVG